MSDIRQQLAALALAVKAKGGKKAWCPHEPFDKQRDFLALTCLEAGYGGAAGGGKSDALLMAALQHVDVPGYAAIIFRRTFADLNLAGAIMDRSKEWLTGTGATFNESDHRWTFPSGATISFGYMDKEADRFRYQSAEFQFIAFDELTQFPEKWYRFMFSRLRKTKELEVPLRMRFATNPGGIGHEWVFRRFGRWLDSKGSRIGDGVELTFRRNEEDREEECPPGVHGSWSRTFIVSNRRDNPHIGEEYAQSLAQLDEATRKQLDKGLWIRDTGGLVYRFNPSINHFIPPEKFKTEYHVLAHDYGFTDSTAYTIYGWRDHDKRVYMLKSFKRKGLTPSAAAEISLELNSIYQFNAMVGDIGGLGKGYAEEARSRFGLPIEAAQKQNKRGYIELMNDAFVNGRIMVVKGENDGLEAEYSELPWNADRSAPEDGFEDHIADAALYGFRKCLGFAQVEIRDKPPMTSEQIEDAMEAEDTALSKRDDWFSGEDLAELRY